jgi:hypothetical protein
LTPEEIALVLRALDIDRSMQIYIAAGEIYGGKRRMAALTSAYPNVVWTKLCTCIFDGITGIITLQTADLFFHFADVCSYN